MWDKWRPDLVVGLFLLAHLALSWQFFPALWGLDLLYYAPWGYALVLALGAVALWLPWPAALTAADPWRRDGWGRLARLALATGGLAFFVLWHTRTHLLGDGYLMLRELGMLVDRTGNEPLALWVLAKLYRAELGLGAEAVYRTASYAAGVCYIGLSFAVAAALSAERKGRWIALGILLSAGYLQLFCGYVENYPPLFAGTLLYLWGGVLLMRGQLPLWVLSGGLALLMTYHFIAAMLGPSLLVATWLGWRRGHGVGWGRLVGGLALGPVVVLAILYGIGLDLFAYATGLRGGHLLPVWTVPDTTQAYGLLDLRHGLDLLSVQLLAGAGAGAGGAGLQGRMAAWVERRAAFLRRGRWLRAALYRAGQSRNRRFPRLGYPGLSGAAFGLVGGMRAGRAPSLAGGPVDLRRLRVARPGLGRGQCRRGSWNRAFCPTARRGLFVAPCPRPWL
ncbi:MAG: hypothetical protein QGH25_02370 [Candidatus Latescibacteria bacterium]|nr:hypothetical protein [Candidatus Latescibacterota bacterium]